MIYLNIVLDLNIDVSPFKSMEARESLTYIRYYFERGSSLYKFDTWEEGELMKTKLKYAYDKLPDWLTVTFEVRNKEGSQPMSWFTRGEQLFVKIENRNLTLIGKSHDDVNLTNRVTVFCSGISATQGCSGFQNYVPWIYSDHTKTTTSAVNKPTTTETSILLKKIDNWI